MTTIIVAMDYDQSGHRAISALYYNASADMDKINRMSEKLYNQHDEVWLTDIDPADKPFIDTIITTGCKFSLDR